MQVNFQTTRWSLVLQAGDARSPVQREALEKLLQDSWFPLYTFVRKSGKSSQEAEDLIQGFFGKLLEKNLLAGIEEHRQGRFRNFLLVCLKNFINDQWKKDSAAKRGGGIQPISIDVADADLRIGVEPFHELTPEKAFDRAWALEVVQRSLQRVQNTWQDSGKADAFKILKPYLLPVEQTAPYQETAATLQTTVPALKVRVHRLRAELRRALCDEVAETLGTHEFLEDEINQLFSAICL